MIEPATTARLLGDRTRSQVVAALAAGPLRTGELAVATGATPAALSRHLSLLRDGQLVARRDVADDGRGRAYELRPAALEALAGWLRSTSWAAELAQASDRPQTQTLLARMGAFLDAFADGDVTFFQRHLHVDVVLVFPGMASVVDKQACLDSVPTHSPYHRHRVLTEPVARALGAATTLITFTAEVATAADGSSRPMFITAVIEEGEPWQLVHLQWTPAAPAEEGETTDD